MEINSYNPYLDEELSFIIDDFYSPSKESQNNSNIKLSNEKNHKNITTINHNNSNDIISKNPIKDNSNSINIDELKIDKIINDIINEKENNKISINHNDIIEDALNLNFNCDTYPINNGNNIEQNFENINSDIDEMIESFDENINHNENESIDIMMNSKNETNNVNIGKYDINKNNNDKLNNHHPDKNDKSNISFHFTSDKAGMLGLDKDKINKIVEEHTKNSTIYKKNLEERKKIEHSVQEWISQINLLMQNKNQIEHLKSLMEEKIKIIKKERINTQIWLHLDMDMFFAAVEIRDNPKLKNFPVAVGNERMVSTSNYIARKYGVRSAMPGFIAKKLCPELIFVDHNMEKYGNESKKFMSILRQYDLYMESVSLDEAYLDMTGYFNSKNISKIDDSTIKIIEETIKEIKMKIYSETGLTASIGIGSNKMLAKICSDINKPDGHYILNSDSEVEEQFMKNLKIRKIPGIGPKTEIKFSLMGINTCNDFLENSVKMFFILPESNFENFYKCCIGIGSYIHEDRSLINKSISCSETFKVTNLRTLLYETFNGIIKKLYKQMCEDEIGGKTISVDVTDNEENHFSVSESVKDMIETELELRKYAYRIFDKILLDQKKGFRLLRVRLSGLKKIDKNRRGKGKENIAKLLDKVRDKMELSKVVSEVIKVEKEITKVIKQISNENKNNINTKEDKTLNTKSSVNIPLTKKSMSNLKTKNNSIIKSNDIKKDEENKEQNKMRLLAMFNNAITKKELINKEVNHCDNVNKDEINKDSILNNNVKENSTDEKRVINAFEMIAHKNNNVKSREKSKSASRNKNKNKTSKKK